MVKKKSSYRSSRLTAEQESLLRQEKELREKEALLRRRLQQLPAAMEKKRLRQKERQTKAIYTTFTGSAEQPGPVAGRGSRRHSRGASLREKRAAKIKFVILILILTSLLILIWQSLPT